MGGDDGAYKRNEVAAQWEKKLDSLQAADSGGYQHQVVIHEGKGHWMDRQETMAFPWMAGFSRNPYPKKIVWVQDDVTRKQFYWLAVDDPQPRTKTVASINGQSLEIQSDHVGSMTLYFNDSLVNVDLPVKIIVNKKELGSFKLTRSPTVIRKTLRDEKDFYVSSVEFEIPN